MEREEFEDLSKTAARRIAASEYAIAFTGAGISVESGIPPFRGPAGIWASYDQSLLDIDRYIREPAACWKAIKELFYSSMTQAEPNGAHMVLANWERAGKLKFTITQNIDGLHQKAGASRIAEYHGNANSLVCMKCGERCAVDKYLPSAIPNCPKCAGLLKPDFVFFGEGIPEKAAADSRNAALRCDCLLIIGSSGEVYPAATLPHLAKRRGAAVIEINPEKSSYTDSIVDIYIPRKAAETLTTIDKYYKKSFIS